MDKEQVWSVSEVRSEESFEEDVKEGEMMQVTQVRQVT